MENTQQSKKKIIAIVGTAALAIIIAGILLWVFVFKNSKAPYDLAKGNSAGENSGAGYNFANGEMAPGSSKWADAVITDPDKDRGRFSGFTHVVISDDTPKAVLEALKSYGITGILYEMDTTLFAPGNPYYLAKTDGKSKVLLCEGTYDSGYADFVEIDESSPITFIGEGEEKTKITPTKGSRTSLATAFLIRSRKTAPIKDVRIEGMTISGFKYGVSVVNGNKITLEKLTISKNEFIGVAFENTTDSVINNCKLDLNGNPLVNDLGYGMSLLGNVFGISGTGNIFTNNANNNAVDFAKRGISEKPEGFEVQYTASFDLDVALIPIADPNKPTAKSLTFELEDGVIDGEGAVISTSTEKVEKYSGKGYVFLFNSDIRLKVNVPKAGKYKMFVKGTPDEPNNKCDYIQVNGGTKYLTSFFGKNHGKWQLSQPGAEVWSNNELHPVPPENGFEFKAGDNEILITANWGYCAYDAIILEYMG